jgi:hypothetical protein
MAGEDLHLGFQPAPNFLPVRISDDLHRIARRTQHNRDNNMRLTVEFQRRFAIMAFCDERFLNLTFVVYSPSKVARFTTYFYKNLVQKPLSVPACAQLLYAFPMDFGCENRAVLIPPKPNGLLTDIDAALVQRLRQFEGKVEI